MEPPEPQFQQEAKTPGLHAQSLWTPRFSCSSPLICVFEFWNSDHRSVVSSRHRRNWSLAVLESKDDHRAIRIDHGNRIAVEFRRETPALQVFCSLREIRHGEDNSRLGHRRRGFKFNFLSRRSWETQTNRLATITAHATTSSIDVLERQLGAVERLLRLRVSNRDDSAQQVLRNAAIAKMLAAVPKVKRSRKVLCVLEQLSLGIAKHKEQIAGAGLLAGWRVQALLDVLSP